MKVTLGSSRRIKKVKGEFKKVQEGSRVFKNFHKSSNGLMKVPKRLKKVQQVLRSYIKIYEDSKRSYGSIKLKLL